MSKAVTKPTATEYARLLKNLKSLYPQYGYQREIPKKRLLEKQIDDLEKKLLSENKQLQKLRTALTEITDIVSNRYNMMRKRVEQVERLFQASGMTPEVMEQVQALVKEVNEYEEKTKLEYGS